MRASLDIDRDTRAAIQDRRLVCITSAPARASVSRTTCAQHLDIVDLSPIVQAPALYAGAK